MTTPVTQVPIIIDQATGLPDSFNDTLQTIKTLKSREDWNIWESMIKAILNIHSHQSLIDSSIPRPSPANPAYTRWRKLSGIVRMWLFVQVDESIIKQIINSSTPNEYADDFWKAIKAVVFGSGHRINMQVWKEAVYINREHFSTVQQFVNAFRDKIHVVCNLELPMNAYIATNILFDNIEKDMPNWVQVQLQKLTPDSHKTMKMTEFFQHCQSAIDEARSLDVQMAAFKSQKKNPPTKSPNPKSSDHQSNTKRNDFSDTKLFKRNCPPKGMHPNEYVKNWRAYKPEKSPNGTCSFCNCFGHGTGMCYYLWPEQRPENWKPHPSLWCYKPPEDTKNQNPNTPSSPQNNFTNPSSTPNVSNLAQQLPDGYYNICGMALSTSIRHDFWIADTGSGESICNNRSMFTEFSDTNDYSYATAGPAIENCKGKGKVLLKFKKDDGSTNDLIIDAFYNPNSPCNLFNAERAKFQYGLYYHGKHGTLNSCQDDSVFGYTQHVNGIPVLILDDNSHLQLASIDAKTLHQRLAHCGKDRLAETAKINDYQLKNTNFHCEPCLLGKARKKISRTPQMNAKQPGWILHVDLQTIKPTGLGGYKYAMIIIDGFSRCRWVIFLKGKHEAAEKLISFITALYNSTGSYPVVIRCDVGSEFFRFITWVETKGTTVETTAPYTHEQNGVSERHGGYVVQTSRVMMIDAGLSPYLWPLAMEAAVYILNRLKTTNEEKPPAQIWREFFNLPHPNVTVQHIRIWGAKAYYQIPEERRVKANKMEPRRRIGYLVGYIGDHGHLFKIWFPDKNEIKITRDVDFHEGKDDESPLFTPSPGPPDDSGPNNEGFANDFRFTLTSDIRKNVPKFLDIQPQNEEEPITGRVQTLSPTPVLPTTTQAVLPAPESTTLLQPTTAPVTQSTLEEIAPTSAVPPSTILPSIEPTRISSRSSKGIPPKRLEDEQAEQKKEREERENRKQNRGNRGTALATPNSLVKIYHIKVPNTYAEMLKSPQKDLWWTAMQLQVEKLAKKNTWKLVERHPTMDVLPGKWVWDTKQNSDNIILEYRARWVACGNFEQRQNFPNYSPVATEASIKILFSYITIHDLKWKQFDMVTAYLNAAIKNRSIYMRQPTGFEQGENLVCQLLQAIYGLRDSAFFWYETFVKELKKRGFKALPEDPCVFVKKSKDSYILIYVDDAIIAAQTDEEIDTFLAELDKVFKLKILGEPQRFLGCDIYRDYTAKTITISQSSYVEKIISLLNDHNLKGTEYPMVQGWKPANNKEGDPNSSLDYIELTGKLNWLSIKTRPDITQSIARLQRRSSSPTDADFDAVKRIYRYLKSYPRYGIVLGQIPTQPLTAFVDASYADCEKGRSTESYVFMLGGAPIAWSSKRQQIVAHSTTVAEYCSMNSMVRQGLYLQNICRAIGFEFDHPLPVFTDSGNVIKLLNKPGYSPGIRHLDVRYHYVKESKDENRIRIEKIDGTKNPADGLTKPYDNYKFVQFRNLIGLKETDFSIENSSDSEDDE
jgi:hypothetical protein